MEAIKEYLPLILAAIAGGIGGWFSLRSRVERLEHHRQVDSDMLRHINESVDQLEKNEASNNATRDQMLEMLKENRLDVKEILQRIATLSANQKKPDDG